MPKRKVSFQYKLRRFFLVIILLGAIGAVCWYVIQAGINPPKLTEDTSSSSLSSDAGSSSAPKPLPMAEDSSEDEPESEPESASPEDDWTLLLVNPSHPIPEGYLPELETITDDFRVDKRIADSVKLLFIKAKEEGINLKICSAYRTVEYQENLFSNKKNEYLAAGTSEDEAVAAAATIVAVPGSSEHHTGLALDIVTPEYQSLDEGFADTPAFKWLDQNAYKYGFIMRYPKDKQDITGIIYEPWHYRYVGVENAANMKKSGECLEEYISSLSKKESEASAQPAVEGAESVPSQAREEDSIPE